MCRYTVRYGVPALLWKTPAYWYWQMCRYSACCSVEKQAFLRCCCCQGQGYKHDGFGRITASIQPLNLIPWTHYRSFALNSGMWSRSGRLVSRTKCSTSRSRLSLGPFRLVETFGAGAPCITSVLQYKLVWHAFWNRVMVVQGHHHHHHHHHHFNKTDWQNAIIQ